MSMTIIHIDKYEDLRCLQSEWDILHAETGSRNPFSTFTWCACWWKHFGQGKQLRIFIFRNDGKTSGILPLVSLFPLPCAGRPIMLQLPGMPLADWEDLLLSPDRNILRGQITEFLDYLSTGEKHWDWIYLKRLFLQDPPFSMLLDEIRNRADFRHYLLPSETHSFIPIESSWDAYFQKRSGKQRYNLRRARKLLNQKGKVEFQKIEDPDRIEHALDAIDDLSRKSRKYDRGTSLVRDSHHRSFFSEIAGEFLSRGSISLWQLKIDGKVIGCEYSLVYNGNYYGYYSDFDPEYSRCSPGLLILSHVIQDSFNNRLNAFHLGAGSGFHKEMWSAVEKSSFELHLIRNTPASRFMLLPALKAWQAVKRSGKLKRFKTEFNHLPFVVRIKKYRVGSGKLSPP
jgi:CelD/BcsL family acetyltransferase involved in cellulose biosynthesis